MLENELNENYKKIRMLNKGSQNLDQILGMGRVDTQHRGLGYHGGSCSFGNSMVEPIGFVKECKPTKIFQNESTSLEGNASKVDKGIQRSDTRAQGNSTYA